MQAQRAFAFQTPLSFPHLSCRVTHVCPQYRCVKRLRPSATASPQRTLDPLATSPLGAPQVIAVGEALYDLVTDTPEAPTEDKSQWTPAPGGAPANLAAALARLSTASALFGAVGSDEGGTALKELLSSLNVNVDGMLQVPGRTTREVFVRRDASGERAFVGFSGPNSEFADSVELDADALPGVLFYAAQFIVTGTLGLAFDGSRASLKELVELARMCKLTVVVDVNWRPVFWEGQKGEADARAEILRYLRGEPGADLVKISCDEVGFLLDEKLARVALEQPEEVLRAIGGRCTGVIVTAGEKGAAYAFSGGMEVVTGRVEAVRPKGAVVDTIGAGDAFLAGFLSEMLQMGGPFALTDAEKTKRIAKFAAVVASFVVAGVGGIDPAPTRDQVEVVMAELAA